MFFCRRNAEDSSHRKLADKILKELEESFRKRGIDDVKIKIDVKSDNMNLYVHVAEN